MDIHKYTMCVNEKFFWMTFFVQNSSFFHTTLTQRLSASQAIVYKDKSVLIHRSLQR